MKLFLIEDTGPDAAGVHAVFAVGPTRALQLYCQNQQLPPRQFELLPADTSLDGNEDVFKVEEYIEKDRGEGCPGWDAIFEVSIWRAV